MSRGESGDHIHREKDNKSLHEQIESSRPTAPRYVIHDAGAAQFAIMHAHPAVCTINDDGNPLFSFPDTVRLRDDVAEYVSGAKVAAVSFVEAGRILRRLLAQARTRSYGYRRNGGDRRTGRTPQ